MRPGKEKGVAQSNPWTTPCERHLVIESGRQEDAVVGIRQVLIPDKL